MELCSIILNYNSLDDTKKIVLNIMKNDIYNKIIIVDNNSPDGSYNKLRYFFSNYPNIIILKNRENGGYSNGNNYGLKFALEQYNPKYFLIVNPDVEIPPEFIKNMNQYLENDHNLASITGIMKKSDGTNFQDIAWKLPIIFDDLILNITLLTHIKNPVKYNSFYLNSIIKDVFYVDCIPGACFMIRSDVMEKIGFFDENYFLYCEERTLAKKIKDIGMKNGISLNDWFIHNHKDQKNLKDILMHRYWLYKSRYYYNITYNKYGIYILPLIILTSILGIIETIIIFFIKNYLFVSIRHKSQ